MAFDTFLKIEGPSVEGEATASGMEKQIEVLSFSWGAASPTTVGSGTTGLSAGKVAVSPFTFTKKLDKSSTALFQACCDGQHFTSVTLTMRKSTGASGGQKTFLTYKFTDCLISSVQLAGSTGGDDTPTESVSLAFSRVNIEYFQQKSKDGSMAKAGNAGWDLTQVKKI